MERKIGMDYHPRWGGTWWESVEEREDDPFLLAARILEQRQVGIWTTPAVKKDWLRFPTVEIHRTFDGGKVLDLVLKTPEFLALMNADNVGPLRWPESPNLDSCQWDEATKRRVEAYYWTNRALKYKRIIVSTKELPDEVAEYKRKMEESQSCAGGLLGDLKPLTPGDIRALIENVVERELVAPHPQK